MFCVPMLVILFSFFTKITDCSIAVTEYKRDDLMPNNCLMGSVYARSVLECAVNMSARSNKTTLFGFIKHSCFFAFTEPTKVKCDNANGKMWKRKTMEQKECKQVSYAKSVGMQVSLRVIVHGKNQALKKTDKAKKTRSKAFRNSKRGRKAGRKPKKRTKAVRKPSMRRWTHTRNSCPGTYSKCLKPTCAEGRRFSCSKRRCAKMNSFSFKKMQRSQKAIRIPRDTLYLMFLSDRSVLIQFYFYELQSHVHFPCIATPRVKDIIFNLPFHKSSDRARIHILAGEGIQSIIYLKFHIYIYSKETIIHFYDSHRVTKLPKGKFHSFLVDEKHDGYALLGHNRLYYYCKGYLTKCAEFKGTTSNFVRAANTRKVYWARKKHGKYIVETAKFNRSKVRRFASASTNLDRKGLMGVSGSGKHIYICGPRLTELDHHDRNDVTTQCKGLVVKDGGCFLIGLNQSVFQMKKKRPVYLPLKVGSNWILK